MRVSTNSFFGSVSSRYLAGLEQRSGSYGPQAGSSLQRSNPGHKNQVAHSCAHPLYISLCSSLMPALTIAAEGTRICGKMQALERSKVCSLVEGQKVWQLLS